MIYTTFPKNLSELAQEWLHKRGVYGALHCCGVEVKYNIYFAMCTVNVFLCVVYSEPKNKTTTKTELRF